MCMGERLLRGECLMTRLLCMGGRMLLRGECLMTWLLCVGERLLRGECLRQCPPYGDGVWCSHRYAPPNHVVIHGGGGALQRIGCINQVNRVLGPRPHWFTLARCCMDTRQILGKYSFKYSIQPYK